MNTRSSFLPSGMNSLLSREKFDLLSISESCGDGLALLRCHLVTSGLLSGFPLLPVMEQRAATTFFYLTVIRIKVRA